MNINFLYQIKLADLQIEQLNAMDVHFKANTLFEANEWLETMGDFTFKIPRNARGPELVEFKFRNDPSLPDKLISQMDTNIENAYADVIQFAITALYNHRIAKK